MLMEIGWKEHVGTSWGDGNAFYYEQGGHWVYALLKFTKIFNLSLSADFLECIFLNNVKHGKQHIRELLPSLLNIYKSHPWFFHCHFFLLELLS